MCDPNAKTSNVVFMNYRDWRNFVYMEILSGRLYTILDPNRGSREKCNYRPSARKRSCAPAIPVQHSSQLSPKVAGSIPTVVRQTFQLDRCGCTLRVTSQISYSPEYITPTHTKKYYINTWRKNVGVSFLNFLPAFGPCTLCFYK
jgi:hypothetical protein